MTKISIFASREHHPDFLSKMIMKKIKADYSHIGILVRMSSGEGLVYDATGKGVGRQFLSSFLIERQIANEIDITPFVKNIDYASGWLDGSLGIEYSQSQYLGFIIPWLRSLVRNGKEKMVCSEYPVYFIESCTTLNSLVLDADFVSPSDLMTALSEAVNEK